MKEKAVKTANTKRYSLGEEIFNSVTHGVGSLLSIAGTAVLIVLAAIYSDAWGVVSSAVYGGSLIILYTMSTLYHAITNPRAKAFFRIMDHNTISRERILRLRWWRSAERWAGCCSAWYGERRRWG